MPPEKDFGASAVGINAALLRACKSCDPVATAASVTLREDMRISRLCCCNIRDGTCIVVTRVLRMGGSFSSPYLFGRQFMVGSLEPSA